MLLKHRKDITEADAAYIETAFFAVGQVEGARRRSDDYSFGGDSQGILNLKTLLQDGQTFYASTSNEELWERLLNRVRDYEILLVGSPFRPPFAPLFRWKADTSLTAGGTWECQEWLASRALSWPLNNAVVARFPLRKPGLKPATVLSSTSATATPPAPTFSEQLQFLTAEGHAYRRMDYRLTLAGGTRLEGRTDEQGNSQRIVTQQSLAIERVEFYTKELTCCPLHDLMHDAEDDAPMALSYQLRGISTHASPAGTAVVKVTPEWESRPLTIGEIDMCKPIFRYSIDYNKVRVHNREWLIFGLQPDNTAMTPNGELYFNPKWFEADFSAPKNTSPLYPANILKAWFLHEMTHVWQYQLGYGVKWHGMQRWKLDYHYTLDPAKNLCDYNMEAQGNIIADYFAHGVLQDPSALSHTVHVSDPLSLYQTVLSAFLFNPTDPENLPK